MSAKWIVLFLAALIAPGILEAQDPLLESKSVEIGGSLYSEYTGFMTWADAYPDFSNLGSGVSDLLVPDLQAQLYFDARPASNFRVFTKLRAVYPFSSSPSVFVSQTTPLNPFSLPGGSSLAVPNISVFELYADVSWNDAVSFRVGQQVVNWGVGFFFSPADIISLTPIDPLRPDLVREGPVALRVNVPFADADSVSLYVIANQQFSSNGLFQVEDLAVAPKVEMLFGGYEIGIGGYYQRSQRPKAMATMTGSILGQVGVFGEAVISYGADRTFVQAAPGVPGVYEAYADTSTPFFSGTIGLKYSLPDWHVSLTAQYYFNGQGYANGDLERGARAAFRQQLLGAAPVSGPLLSPMDVFQSGQHYLAGLARWTDILASRVDLGLFYEGNFSDGSGVVSPSVAYTPFEYVTITVAPFVTYGPPGSELVTYFGRLSFSVTLTVGEGTF